MKELCSYCGSVFDKDTMTPITEKGKPYVAWYCEEHFPQVKAEILKFPWYKRYTFGTRGKDPDLYLNK